MFMLGLHHRFKADSMELHKLMSPAQGGKGFLLKGMRNPFLELGCQACLHPWDLRVTCLPLKKQAVFRCYLQPNPLPSQWELKIQCPLINELICFGRCHWHCLLSPVMSWGCVWAVAMCVRAALFASSRSLASHQLTALVSAVGTGGRTADMKWISGLKKCVSLSEEFLVPISMIEPYDILYNFIFISYLICSVLYSSPALPANPSSHKSTNAFLELTTSVIQKSSLPFKPVPSSPNWAQE